MGKTTVYLSIGSNLGDKVLNLNNAIAELKNYHTIEVIDVSQFYKTEPQNYADQDWFVNAAIKIETSLDPDSLLTGLKSIEKKLDPNGKPFRFGPRIIDLDIVYFGNLIFKSGQLEIPHPRMHERCFVLIPICDIGSQTIHPVFNKRSDELLKKIEKQETQKVMRLDKED